MKYLREICIVGLTIAAFATSHYSIAAAQVSDTQSPDIVVSARSLAECPDLLGAEALSSSLRERGVKFVVVGEYHGTVETPLFFGDLACYIAKYYSVNILLEISEKDQGDLDRFFASKDLKQATSDLLATRTWSSSLQDGRFSAAMLDLLKSLRTLKRRNPSVEIYATQPNNPSRLVYQAYGELATAYKWVAIADKDPERINLILVGNFQASKRVPGVSGFIAAAGHLPSRESVSFSPESQGGNAWGCVGPKIECGEHPVPGRGLKPRYVSLYPQGVDGFDGSYSVGSKFSSSFPASSPEGLKKTQ